ncbi:MAG: gliding motility-associated C-terminal domain-containing protein [Bacteroidota bacterium]
MKKTTFQLVLLVFLFTNFLNAQIVDFPYSEDFESGDGGWVVDNGSAGTWALGEPVNDVINGADSGVNAWVTNLTGDYNSNDNSSVTSPIFDFSSLSAPSIELSIWWNSEFSWDGAVLQSSIDGGATWQNVGNLDDPNNWYNDDTIAGDPGGQPIGWSGRGTANGSQGWVIARNALSGLAGESNVQLRIAFGSDGSVVDEGFAFDSINIFEVLCPEPNNISIDQVTENSAEINWSAGGTETVWEIAVQTAGTGIPSGAGESTSSNNPYEALNLDPSTAYEFYLRSDCGAGEFSAWVGPFNFTTLNTPPPSPVGVTCSNGSSSFIFTEDFEQDPPSGWTGTSFTGSDGDWDITEADTNSGGTGPSVAFDGGTGMHLEYEASGNATDIASAISPAIDLSTALDGAELSFFMHAFGDAIGTLNVGVSNSATGPFTNLFTWVGNLQITEDEAWVPIGINLDAYLGQVIYLEFSYGGAGNDFTGDMSIDQIRVESCGEFCIPPNTITAANITGTTADISWTGNNGETSWEYVLSPAGTGEPTGPGTTIGTSTVSLADLEFETAYEFWVRADCGNGEFSVWSGPFNFTTTIQIVFDIDCSVGPLNNSLCYGNNDTEIFSFTSSDGSSLNLTFDSGEIEGAPFDFLVVFDSDGVTELYNDEGNDGDISGLTFQSTGDTIFFQIQSDGSVSCESGSTCCSSGIDYTVSCATCNPPIFTSSVVSDCLNLPQFFVDVDLTNLGSANSVTLTDNQGGTPQNTTTIGQFTFGPYANGTQVEITVANDDDVNCTINSELLTQEFCLENTVDCSSGPLNASYCYDNNDPNVFSFTSSDGSPLNLTFNSGVIEGAPFDFLVVLDSDGVTEIYNDEGNDGNLAGLTFQSTGDTIFFQITSDGSVSCQSSGGDLSNGIDYTVSCATCINPAATFQVIDDCDNGDQFLIDVNVTSLGDATSLTISNNIDATTLPVTAVGTYQIGPFPFLVDVIVTISNDQDVNCVINSSPIQLLACPPENDNPCDATVAVVNEDDSCNLVTPGTIIEATPSGVPAGSCTGNPDDDVWFQFVAAAEVQLISLINDTGGFGLNHAIYEGTCDGLVELECTPGTASISPQLTIGETYFIRVFSNGSDSETNTFDLCIKEAPTNIICENAENFCSDGGALTTSNVIGIPDPTDIACLFSAPNPTWNIIQIGDSGLIEIEINQTDDNGGGLDVDFVLWGPFDSLDTACTDLDLGCPNPGGDCPNNTSNDSFYPFGNIVDCSYSAQSVENLTIDNAISGEIYILLVTNFSDDPGTISIEQTNGGGTTDGNVTAEIEVELGEDQEFCGFPDFVINAESPFADRYEWYANGFIIEGETGSTLTVTETNTYTVIAFDDQCGVQAQDSITLTFGQEPVANPVDDLVTCDDISGDGIAEFDLDSQTAAILGGQNPDDFNVSYHASLVDAQLNQSPLVSPYTNISNPQTIFVRVEDQGLAICFVTTSFDLVIEGAEPVIDSVPLEQCGDEAGFSIFDLVSHIPNLLDGQNIADFDVTFYLNETDANNSENAIENPSAFTSGSQTLFIRVSNTNASNCFAIGSFDIISIVTPIANPVDDIITCDDSSGDGFEEFDLEQQTPTILGNQSSENVNITYHASQDDADNDVANLVSPYINLTNPQTIYVRVENADQEQCFSTTTFEINISGTTPTVAELTLQGCDLGDNTADFDLLLSESDILDGQNIEDFIISFHESQNEALSGVDAIDTSVLYNSGNALIYVRVESNLTTDCFTIAPLNLEVLSVPITTFDELFDFEVCPDATVPILIEAIPGNYSEEEVSIVWYRDGSVIEGENSLELPILEPGFYEIEVTFNNGIMCMAEAVGREIIELESCVIPQGISPNNDGLNDTFDLSGFQVSSIEIFNRFGASVYVKANYTDEWFGQTDDGEELPVGTYFYSILFEDGERQTGWVYIQREN